MPNFEYQAIDPQGKKHKGTLDGDSAKQIRQILRERQLVPLQINLAKKSSEKLFLSSWIKRDKITTADLALITRQLATLLNAGLPIEEALQAVTEQCDKNNLKNIIATIRNKVREGLPLADAFSQFPKIFSHLYCATIAAAEQSGQLDNVLLRLADYLEKQTKIQRKIQQALIYPIFMLSISLLIIGFLLSYVVPNILALFNENQAQLPAITLILMSISHFISSYGIYLLIGIILAIWFFKNYLKHEKNLLSWQTNLLKLPTLGNLIRIINISRFTRTLAILESSAVPLLQAMQVAANVVTNIPIRNAIHSAIIKIREGQSIHQSLRQTDYFPAMSLHLIANGENSGQLATMLERVANQFDEDINRYIDTALALFEPVLILLMGAIVLFIVLAVLLPIFNLDQLVQ